MNDKNHKSAIRFIVLLGFVSLFADMTYESARSVTGAYLALLGASATAVGFAAGAGELFGYGLRLLSGLLSDKTKKYWMITIAGYAVNLIAVPLLGLANRWELAAALIIVERIGKAVRSPARDVMLSHATSVVGRGWGFALHEAMDQLGAMTGPVIVMIVLALNGSYRFAFAILAIPAALALTVLIIGRLTFPHPHKMEVNKPTGNGDGLTSVFWFYLIAVCFIAAGFADYPLIAFHIKSNTIFADKWIPLFYALAMGVDALAALFFGRLYDKKGIYALVPAIFISSAFAIFAFSLTRQFVIAGVILWGIGMGAQESSIRAVVADIVPSQKRGTGYGLFNCFFGVAWFAGSVLMGILYDLSIPAMIAMSVISQLISLPLLIAVHRRMETANMSEKAGGIV